MIDNSSLIFDKREIIQSKDITFVVQGVPAQETYTFFEEIRRHFPQSEIILSTWEGLDIEVYRRVTDKVVFSKDPGAICCSFYREIQHMNNINRQIVSTVAGINAASRKYVVKMRTDFTLSSNKLLAFWNQYPKREKEAILFQHRIVVPSIYSRLYSDRPEMIPTPFHPSDMFAFGLKEDIALMFGSCPLQSQEELGHWKMKYPNRAPYREAQWRWSPEQALFYNAVKTKFPDIPFYDGTDFSKTVLTQSKRLLMNNFVFVNPSQIGLFSFKHLHELRDGNLRNWPGIISNRVFEDWYKSVLDPSLKYATNARGSYTDRFDLHMERLRNGIRQTGTAVSTLAEPFACLWYALQAKIAREKRIT